MLFMNTTGKENLDEQISFLCHWHIHVPPSQNTHYNHNLNKSTCCQEEHPLQKKGVSCSCIYSLCNKLNCVNHRYLTLLIFIMRKIFNVRQDPVVLMP